MGQKLTGWTRVGVIVAVFWAIGCPFIVGPMAEQNSNACGAVEHLRQTGQPLELHGYVGQANPCSTNYDATYLANQKLAARPKICLAGWASWADLRVFPNLSGPPSEAIAGALVWLIVLAFETAAPILLLGLLARATIGLFGWVREGFTSGDNASADARDMR